MATVEAAIHALTTSLTALPSTPVSDVEHGRAEIVEQGTRSLKDVLGAGCQPDKFALPSGRGASRDRCVEVRHTVITGQTGQQAGVPRPYRARLHPDGIAFEPTDGI
ncbi:hypothetical protein OG520_40200 (plasmid) [Streptomyces sp. NBC_00984]|nr:hypothetical protein OG520_40200 [Streptomyces sp. NBC_00984]